MFAEICIRKSKLKKEWFIPTKDGDHLIKLIIKDSPNDKYGNDYSVSLSVPKEEREKGTKYGPFVGSGKDIGKGYSDRPKSNQQAPRQTQAPGSPVIHDETDSVPF